MLLTTQMFDEFIVNFFQKNALVFVLVIRELLPIYLRLIF
jgi:hypothetical protein